MLCAKFGSGQSVDWPILAHALFPVWHVTMIEQWRIVAVKQRTKISFLSTKRSGENF